MAAVLEQPLPSGVRKIPVVSKNLQSFFPVREIAGESVKSGSKGRLGFVGESGAC